MWSYLASRSHCSYRESNSAHNYGLETFLACVLEGVSIDEHT
ncbi:hypothetical protein NJ7G_1033 [Natrinema sp. J7-2]|nr:hypothetical protein NJ7G_1033 [Natrinema sp. J7-2]